MQDLNKFIKKVTKQPDGCWIWGASNNDKYGLFKLKNEKYAHRASFILHGNKIPDGMQVLHKCDVPLCVNPNHLFLGTHADNMQDKVNKNRQNNGKKVEIMPFESISATAMIKLLGGCTKVAKLVGVSVPAVSMWQNSVIPYDKLVILAATLEKESHGLISRKALFPLSYKMIWPELE